MKLLSTKYPKHVRLVVVIMLLFIIPTGIWLGMKGTAWGDSPASGGSDLTQHVGYSVTMSDGLLSNTIRSITQDQQGFLWLATDNGLCRYDGMNVKQYRNDNLGGNQYTTVVYAAGKTIYVGTSRGVFVLDQKTERFSPLSSKITSLVSSITLDGDNTLWISTSSQGVFQKNGDSEDVEKVSFTGVKSVAITRIYVDSDNQVWALSREKAPYLWRLNKSSNKFSPVQVTSTIADYGAQCMLQTQDGTHWLGTWNNGLMRLNADGSAQAVDAHYQHIHCMFESSPNHILIGCDDGLKEYIAPGATNTTPLLIPNDTKFVYSIIKDNEGGIWYSTFYGGVSYISPIGNYFHTFNSSNTPGLKGQVISHLCEDTSGNIWIASDDGGLSVYSPQSGNVTNIPLSGSDNVHALCLDGSNLWIGTYSDGIYVRDIHTGSTTHITDPSAPKSSYAIFRDSKNRMWVSSMTGILLYNRATQKFRHIKEFNSMIVDIDEDRNGVLWFSTQSDGLWSLDKGNHWKQHNIANNQINNVTITHEGRMYVATGNGLFLYNAKTSQFSKINLFIPIKNVSSMVETQGELWLATDKGIIKHQTKDGIFIYNRYDGLLSEQFLPNAALLSSDGKVYFGSVNGFVAFFPYEIKLNKTEPNVFITSLSIFNEPVEVGSDQLPESLMDIDELDLNSSDEMFTLTFSSLSYCSPKKNQYAYMLEGFDDKWVYCGSDNKATYTNLPAGTYTFHVKGTNNDGFWSSHEATLKIVVHPPFCWSWPMRLLYLVLIIAVIYFYIHERLRRTNERHQEELKQLKDKQEQEAKEAKIKQEQEVKEARLAFFTMIAHEIRTPVSLIIAPLEQLLKSQNDNKQGEMSADSNIPGGSKSLDVINRNAHRLLDLVNQLLDFNKVQHSGLELHFKQTNIRQLMEAVAERFEPTFRKNGYAFEVEYPASDFCANIDPEGITKVISNLLTNANKYTKDHIRLTCVVDSEENSSAPSPNGDAKGIPSFTITVEDNGIGISPEDQKKIFDAFYQARDNKPGTGIGLNIVKRIVSFHNGTINVESEVGKGSKFIVTLTSQAVTPEMSPDDASMEELQNGNAAANGNATTGASAATVATLSDSLPAGEDKLVSSLLLVEDNPDMLEFLSENLSPAYKVLTAENGREALDVLRHNQVSLIVSDWMMPEMDGAEFCRRVRDNVNTSHIPFIMLTAKTDDESKAESMICGADTFIEKPFSVKYLDACIHNLLDMRRKLFQRFSGSPDAPISEISNNTVDDKFLKKMTEIIEANVNNSDLNVNFLAEQLAISRSGLFAKIKSIADSTPNEMIQVIRLKRAAQLLSTKQYRINEVCYMVGFSNPSYFSKCFAKQFGKKPAEFIAEQ